MKTREKLFSENTINTGRQNEFDWAKSFTILVMVVVHTYEMMGAYDPEATPLTGPFRIILEFLAGPTGAPLFMFSMGIGLIYSRNTLPRKMFIRGGKLMRNGYLLSFFKGTLPLLILTYVMGVSHNYSIPENFFGVSILQFAGMAFFTIALMKIGRFPLPLMLAVSIATSIAGTWLAQASVPEWPGYFLGLLFVTNDSVSFPLMTWLFYPVAGMIFASVLQHVTDKGRFYRWCFLIGAGGAALTCIVYKLAGLNIMTYFQLYERTFYHQTILHYIFTTFVILLAMAVYYLCSELVKAKAVTTVVSFLGRNLDVIYIVQWIVVCYVTIAVTLTGVGPFDWKGILVVGFILTIVSCMITSLYLRWRGRRKSKKRISTN
ncbi:MAG: acyltransferase family protein [Firmicutes bacterium]|nr:acyltransferase family protein [Bacillota bacterium]